MIGNGSRVVVLAKRITGLKFPANQITACSGLMPPKG